MLRVTSVEHRFWISFENFFIHFLCLNWKNLQRMLDYVPPLFHKRWCIDNLMIDDWCEKGFNKSINRKPILHNLLTLLSICVTSLELCRRCTIFHGMEDVVEVGLRPCRVRKLFLPPPHIIIIIIILITRVPGSFFVFITTNSHWDARSHF